MSTAKKPATKPPADRGGRAKGKSKPAKQRRPHNAKREKGWSTLDELVALVGSEAREVALGGELVTMTRKERRLRDEVDKALKGEVRALKLILDLMANYPAVVNEPEHLVTFIRGVLARV